MSHRELCVSSHTSPHSLAPEPSVQGRPCHRMGDTAIHPCWPLAVGWEALLIRNEPRGLAVHCSHCRGSTWACGPCWAGGSLPGPAGATCPTSFGGSFSQGLPGSPPGVPTASPYLRPVPTGHCPCHPPSDTLCGFSGYGSQGQGAGLPCPCTPPSPRTMGLALSLKAAKGSPG